MRRYHSLHHMIGLLKDGQRLPFSCFANAPSCTDIATIKNRTTPRDCYLKLCHQNYVVHEHILRATQWHSPHEDLFLDLSKSYCCQHTV